MSLEVVVQIIEVEVVERSAHARTWVSGSKGGYGCNAQIFSVFTAKSKAI